MRTFCILLCLIFSACSSPSNQKSDTMEDLKRDFMSNLITIGHLPDEGPFKMTYEVESVLVSDHVVSLLGTAFNDNPHGWMRTEGKTYVKSAGSFKELTLDDLFPQVSQNEFLRSYCKKFCEQSLDPSYLETDPPIAHLEIEDINVFFVDQDSLVLIFHLKGYHETVDSVFKVKIPFAELTGKWEQNNPLERQLPFTKKLQS